MRILLTGSAGFIGFHVAKRFLDEGHEVYGVDNLNDYYDVTLKEARLQELKKYTHFFFKKLELSEKKAVEKIFSDGNFDCVLHLAAQAGVRYSIDHPEKYVDANIVAFLNILEACRHAKTPHLVYASSSSVYGANTKQPFSETDAVDHPVSLYGATKRANELMAHTYSHLYQLPTTGLRFFTVYGPWGRPDMAYYKFIKAILNGEPIDVYNDGNMKRDFTFVDDVVDAIAKLICCVPKKNEAKNDSPSESEAPFQVYNIGNNKPVALMDFIAALEVATGKKAEIRFKPLQDGDVLETFADIEKIKRRVQWKPKINIDEGLQKVVEWYRSYRENF